MIDTNRNAILRDCSLVFFASQDGSITFMRSQSIQQTAYLVVISNTKKQGLLRKLFCSSIFVLQPYQPIQLRSFLSLYCNLIGKIFVHQLNLLAIMRQSAVLIANAQIQFVCKQGQPLPISVTGRRPTRRGVTRYSASGILRCGAT